MLGVNNLVSSQFIGCNHIRRDLLFGARHSSAQHNSARHSSAQKHSAQHSSARIIIYNSLMYAICPRIKALQKEARH